MTLGFQAYYMDATYWPSPVQNGWGGLSFGAPQAIKVRWEERIEIFTDKNGTENRSNAIVYTLTHLDEGGYLLLGTSVGVDPLVVPNAMEIKRSDSVPDLRGLHQTNRVFL